MSQLLSFGEISQKAKNGFLRFPITLIWAILGTLYIIWFIGEEGSIPFEDQMPYLKIILIASLGVSWLITTRFLIHYFTDLKQQNKQWLIVFPLFFLGWYYWYLPNNHTEFGSSIYGYKTALYFISGHLFIFFSPFLFTWNKNAYWNYLKAIFITISRSLLFSLVIYLGLVLALLALKYLFKIDIDDEVYFQLFVFSLGIINTWIFLSDFPKNIHSNLSVNYPKVLEIFVKHILIPLSILYLIILYAYSLKIIIQWRLPRGWVSYLVIALSILGFIIHILINPIKDTIKSKIIKRFYPWFYILLLPMLVLLFTAIYKRISEYGFTENRYFVLVLALWILGMTLYILFSKNKQLRYFPMIIMLISLLSSFGFWGAFSVSEKSQIHQFKEIYNTIKAKEFKISNKENNRFRSIIQYLTRRNSISKTESIIGFNPKTTFKDISHWDMATKIYDTLKVEVIYDKNSKINNHGYFGLDRKQNNTIDVKGYDYFKHINLFNIRANKINQPIAKDSILGYRIYLDFNKSSFHLYKDSINNYRIDLEPLINSLLQKQNHQDVSSSTLTIKKEFEDIKVKLIFQNLYINTEEDSVPKIDNVDAFIFIKNKEEDVQ